MGGGSSTHACKQDSRVPLVCPLDLDQSCKTNIFGSVNRNSEKTTNMGVFNWSWYHKLEGGSFMLGLLAGIVLTSVILWLYWRRQKRRRELNNRSQRGRSVSIFRRRPRMRDLEEDMEEAEQSRSWRWPRPSWPSWPSVTWPAASQPALPQPHESVHAQNRALVPASQAVVLQNQPNSQAPTPNQASAYPSMSFSN